MHGYEIDSQERRQVHFVLAFAGIGFAMLLDQWAKQYGISLPFWISMPSPFGIYVGLLSLFDHKLWKLSLLRWAFDIKTPVISGEWMGTLQTRHDGFSQPHSCKVQITQTWRRLCIILETDKSRSHSLVGSISVESGKGMSLIYHYQNEPKGNAPSTMNIHYGSCELIMDADGKTLTGNYFSGRGRSEHGQISLNKNP
jgi:hypothetical protein